jgi:hypothetical protein
MMAVLPLLLLAVPLTEGLSRNEDQRHDGEHDPSAASWPDPTVLRSAAVKQGHVTILATDSAHMRGTLNFLGESLLRHGALDGLLILSTDVQAHELLTSRGANSILVRVSNRTEYRQRDFVWLWRMRLVQHVLRAGVDVLMTDLDAHWLRNPLPAVRSRLAAGDHIVASRALKWPEPQARKWGAVACMGFVYFSAAEPTLMMPLIDDVLRSMLASDRPDDQVALNSMLDAHNLSIQAHESQNIATGITMHGLRVGLLTATQVYRGTEMTLQQAQQDPGCLVYHAPDFLKTGAGVLRLWVPRTSFDAFDEHQLRQAHMWHLRQDWQRRVAAAPALSFSRWVAEINRHPVVMERREAEAASPPLVVFLHVPKAAGTSMASMLMPVFPGCTSPVQCSSRSAAVKSSSSCRLWGCRGHLDLTTVEQTLASVGTGLDSAVLITMLRSPEERAWSEYRYALARPVKNTGSLQFLQVDDGSEEELFRQLRKNMTLQQYLRFDQGEKSSGFGMINNRQTSLFAQRSIAPAFKLRSALRGLSLFDFVGLTEDMGASMRLLAHVLRQRGAGNVAAIDAMAGSAYVHLNRGKKSHVKAAASLPAKLQKMLRRRNSLDSRLYAFARERFYRQLCSQLGECDGPMQTTSARSDDAVDHSVDDAMELTGYTLDAESDYRLDD